MRSGVRSPARGHERRAQTTPIVALVALFAVCAGVSLYATTLDGAMPEETGSALAEPTLDRVYDVTADGGVVSPAELSRAGQVAPDGHRIAVAVRVDEARWTGGERPPSDDPSVDTAARPVAVATGGGSADWGRLRVWVWR